MGKSPSKQSFDINPSSIWVKTSWLPDCHQVKVNICFHFFLESKNLFPNVSPIFVPEWNRKKKQTISVTHISCDPDQPVLLLLRARIFLFFLGNPWRVRHQKSPWKLVPLIWSKRKKSHKQHSGVFFSPLMVVEMMGSAVMCLPVCVCVARS